MVDPGTAAIIAVIVGNMAIQEIKQVNPAELCRSFVKDRFIEVKFYNINKSQLFWLRYNISILVQFYKVNTPFLKLERHCMVIDEGEAFTKYISQVGQEWIVHKDDKDQEFYYNTKTKVSSWEIPEILKWENWAKKTIHNIDKIKTTRSERKERTIYLTKDSFRFLLDTGDMKLIHDDVLVSQKYSFDVEPILNKDNDVIGYKFCTDKHMFGITGWTEKKSDEHNELLYNLVDYFVSSPVNKMFEEIKLKRL